MCFFSREKEGHVVRDWEHPPPRTSYYSNYRSPTANRVATMPLFRGPKKIDVREGHQHQYIEERGPRHRHDGRRSGDLVMVERGHQRRGSHDHGRRSGDFRIEETRRSRDVYERVPVRQIEYVDRR